MRILLACMLSVYVEGPIHFSQKSAVLYKSMAGETELGGFLNKPSASTRLVAHEILRILLSTSHISPLTSDSYWGLGWSALGPHTPAKVHLPNESPRHFVVIVFL